MTIMITVMPAPKPSAHTPATQTPKLHYSDASIHTLSHTHNLRIQFSWIFLYCLICWSLDPVPDLDPDFGFCLDTSADVCTCSINCLFCFCFRPMWVSWQLHQIVRIRCLTLISELLKTKLFITLCVPDLCALQFWIANYAILVLICLF